MSTPEERVNKLHRSAIALYAVLEDAIWQALDSEQGMPHSGVDPAYVIPEFLRRLLEAGYVIVPLAKPSAPSFDPAWDKTPEEIARIQALPNKSRLAE